MAVSPAYARDNKRSLDRRPAGNAMKALPRQYLFLTTRGQRWRGQ
ncbi:MAG: hypothetical protein ACLUHA_13305 [Bacteroides stercoris]